MVANPPAHPLSDLYTTDETAWLEATARLVGEGRFAEVDSENLIEYLTSMARRDKRELTSHLIVLLIHILKWEFQPDKRTPSWASTILEQQTEVEFDVQSRTLRNHAEEVLPAAYQKARRLAARETGMEESAFPIACPWSISDAMKYDLPE